MPGTGLVAMWVLLEVEQGRTSVDDVHLPHCSAGVVEHPFLLEVEVGLDGVCVVELLDDVVDYGGCVVAVSVYATPGNGMQLIRIEDIEVVQTGLKVLVHAVQGGGHRHCEG